VLQLLGSRPDNQQGENNNTPYAGNKTESAGFKNANEMEVEEPAGDDDLPF
jgi:single-strand DNA-binding protein